jgi:hypothetical protein
MIRKNRSSAIILTISKLCSFGLPNELDAPCVLYENGVAAEHAHAARRRYASSEIAAILTGRLGWKAVPTYFGGAADARGVGRPPSHTLAEITSKFPAHDLTREISERATHLLPVLSCSQSLIENSYACGTLLACDTACESP